MKQFVLLLSCILTIILSSTIVSASELTPHSSYQALGQKKFRVIAHDTTQEGKQLQQQDLDDLF